MKKTLGSLALVAIAAGVLFTSTRLPPHPRAKLSNPKSMPFYNFITNRVAELDSEFKQGASAPYVSKEIRSIKTDMVDYERQFGGIDMSDTQWVGVWTNLNRIQADSDKRHDALATKVTPLEAAYQANKAARTKANQTYSTNVTARTSTNTPQRSYQRQTQHR